MGGDGRFWFLFGGIFLLVGVCFLAARLGVNLFFSGYVGFRSRSTSCCGFSFADRR